MIGLRGCARTGFGPFSLLREGGCCVTSHDKFCVLQPRSCSGIRPRAVVGKEKRVAERVERSRSCSHGDVFVTPIVPRYYTACFLLHRITPITRLLPLTSFNCLFPLSQLRHPASIRVDVGVGQQPCERVTTASPLLTSFPRPTYIETSPHIGWTSALRSDPRLPSEAAECAINPDRCSVCYVPAAGLCRALDPPLFRFRGRDWCDLVGRLAGRVTPFAR